MSTPTIYEVRGPAAWITLNRPEKRNAIGDDMIAALLADFDRAMADEAVRVIVLTGADSAFCAGADLKSGGVSAAEGETPFVSPPCRPRSAGRFSLSTAGNRQRSRFAGRSRAWQVPSPNGTVLIEKMRP